VPSDAGTVLTLELSVYDEVLLCPVISHKRHRIMQGCVLPWALLLVNYLLQGVVVWFQWTSTRNQETGEAVGVFGDASNPGVCTRTTHVWEFLDLPPELFLSRKTDEKFYCIPDELLISSRFSQLDLNGDGLWTYAEAKMLSEKFTRSTRRPMYLDQMYMSALRKLVPMTIDPEVGIKGRYPGHLGHLSIRAEDIVNISALSPDCALKFAVKYFIRMDQNSSPRAPGRGWNRTLGGIGEECIKNYTYIPEDFYTDDIASFLPQCTILDPDLCGSALTAFPSLDRFWARWYDADSSDRTRTAYQFVRALAHSSGPVDVEPPDRGCSKVIKDACPLMIPRASWQYWRLQKSALCGNRNVQLNHARVTVQYDKPQRFYGTWGIIQLPFKLFLSLILSLWGMVMVIELQAVVLRWQLLFYLEAPQTNKSCVAVGDGSVKLRAIPAYLRWTNMLLNVLPRTILSVVILTTGTFFLLQVRDTASLISNSLALSFLVTIDDILFLALSSKQHRNWVTSCEPIALPTPAWGRHCRGCSGYGIFVSVATVMLSISLCKYLGPRGNLNLAEAFKCLCDKTGPHCVEALLLLQKSNTTL